MHSDPISDLLTRIRNGINAHRSEVSIPHSKIKEQILSILKKNKFIEDYKIDKSEQFPVINISLNENNRTITLKRISKPGQRIYTKAQEIKKVKNGLGIRIISTSKGLLTDQEARKQKLGGELICEIS